MAARYHVLASDELMASGLLRWPAGLQPVEQEPTDPGRYPGAHWWLFEDDDAPQTLNGKLVDLTIGSVDGQPVITARRPAL
jgi:hypothetical protein